MQTTNLKPLVQSLPLNRDSRGCLSACSFQDIPFTPRRIFVVSDVPRNCERGFHAHKKNQQYLIVGSGVIIVRLCDGKYWYNVPLGKGQCVYVKPLTWAYQKYITDNGSLIVLCSHEYDRADYISDFSKFQEAIYENNSRHDRA